VRLVIVGDDPLNAASRNKNSGRAAIAAVAAENGLQEHVRILSGIDNKTLSHIYLESDLHVFPVRNIPGDVEGFGMVAIEAAAYGVPTVAFAVGGVPDSVSDGVSGWLVDPGDYKTMSRQIVSWLSNQEQSAVDSLTCRFHAEQFSWARFEVSLRQIFRTLLP
jgi:phosphatidylinositol alpha-1,6-mannosyltransferase